MLQARMYLILELLAVDGAAAATGAGGVAGLKHEVWDYAVEDYVVVVAALCERGKVLAGLCCASVSQAKVALSEREGTLDAWSL